MCPCSWFFTFWSIFIADVVVWFKLIGKHSGTMQKALFAIINQEHVLQNMTNISQPLRLCEADHVIRQHHVQSQLRGMLKDLLQNTT